MEAVRQMLKAEALSFLAQIFHPPAILGDWPSWVPRWEFRRMIPLVPECYDASEMRDTYAPNCEILGNKLQVRGCQIAIVVAFSDDLDNTYFDYYRQDAEEGEPLI
jgi:hypothetical protein